MIYFLDTNVLIEAKNYHFSIEEQHKFWDWLLGLGNDGSVKIPQKVYEEVQSGSDELSVWLEAHKDVFFCKTQECVASLPRVAEGYSDPPPSEEELEILKADPYLIAHALAAGGTVISNEKSNRATGLLKKKIPTICRTIGVPCLTLPAFMWEMRHTLLN